MTLQTSEWKTIRKLSNKNYYMVKYKKGLTSIYINSYDKKIHNVKIVGDEGWTSEHVIVDKNFNSRQEAKDFVKDYMKQDEFKSLGDALLGL